VNTIISGILLSSKTTMLLTTASRLLTTTARRTTVTKLSQRGFAIAASSQIQSASTAARGEQLNSTSNLAWMAAALAMGSAVAFDQKADCCGIAGVVGAKGDAR
jgi:hypothetical protein